MVEVNRFLTTPFLIASDIVEIAAPPEHVWTVLTDFPRYGAWNPQCDSITVDAKPGGLVAMTVRDGGQDRVIELTYEITAFEPSRHLAWTGFFPDRGLVAPRDQFVQPIGNGQTAYWTTDIYAGPRASEEGELNAVWVKTAFDVMAHALSQRCL